MKEREIQKKIVSWAREQGHLVIKLSAVGPLGQTGWPDLLVIAKGGKVIFLEVKGEKGELTALQKKRMQDLAQRGQATYLVRSVETARRIIGL